MYTKLLVPLDGSETAEKTLPCARFIAKKLKTAVELINAVDIAELGAHIPAEKARYLENIIENTSRQSEAYLKRIAATFSSSNVACVILTGRPEDIIIEKAAAEPGTLITMATHGRSGLDRWLLGSIAEKVLRGTNNPLLLVRATPEATSEGEAAFKSMIVPLDGSELAEGVLPVVVEIAKNLDLEVILFRSYEIPYGANRASSSYHSIHYDEFIASMREEAEEYLKQNTAQLKKQGLERVSYLSMEGHSADQIISLARKTPENLIAMCTHGRSGVKRWFLGSVTETVVRHSAEPVLILRGG